MRGAGATKKPGVAPGGCRSENHPCDMHMMDGAMTIVNAFRGMQGASG